jgi:hypothetical protein
MTPYPYTPYRTWRTVGRGLAAVARLFLTALDALITAAVGIPPIAWCARQVAALIRETYRIGRYGTPSDRTDLAVVVVDAEVIYDEEDER